ncbi:MAG: futalosine hydrolase [Bacteroidales bacterium]
MRILIIAATTSEVKSITKSNIEVGMPVNFYLVENHQTDILVTGVGAVPTAFYLARFGDNYDFVLNVGIAGTYSDDITVGQVVAVVQDVFGDYGIDDNGEFISLSNAGLMDKSLIIKSDVMHNPWLANINPMSYRLVKGITLAAASGSSDVIARNIILWNPDIETMECAAVFYSCILMKKPFLCIRAISNVVEPRDKRNWKIKESLDNLHKAIFNLLGTISVSGLD